jgi:hypothetical protein
VEIHKEALVLRLTWDRGSTRRRLMTQGEFIREFQGLKDEEWSALPAGPILVEGLDRDQRLAWCGHYKDAQGLRKLLRQLVAETAFAELAQSRSAGQEECK